MMFKRMMILGAAASALAFAGCQSRSQQDQAGQPAGTATDTNVGGSTNDTGGSGSIGGSSGDVSGSGNLGGSVDEQGSADGMDGTDDPPVQQDDQLGGSLERDSVNR